jgi:opacity protein-like surface antigen
LTEQFSAYGKLGGYRGKFSGNGLDNKSNDWTWGAGVQWDLTRNVGLRGELQQYRNFGANDGPNVNVLKVGALYRFQ